MISKEKQAAAQNITLTIAMLLLLVSAAVPIFATGLSRTTFVVLCWTYAFGAVLALAERMSERYEGPSLRLKRLGRMAKVSALLYCVSAFFVVYPLVSSGDITNHRDWIAFLLAGAVMQIYVVFAQEYEQRKLAKQAQKQESDTPRR